MTNGVILALAGFGAGLTRELAARPETVHVDSLVLLPGEVRSHSICRGVPPSAPIADRFGGGTPSARWTRRCNGWGTRCIRRWRHGIEAVLLRIAPEAARTKGLVDQLRFKKEAWNEFLAKNQ
ncbi:hypothetical protein MYCTH_2129150 [Thermothelomyces thermophilus ATCC 42464]|uniref:Uncharacterized protein n=1 Tax=Thermothelomyces thermophilus (strain ATCC 42464 / BCRC 31852 / DSM 1799) TaxID=573729 RepID=G2QKF1_THET4|nr:uncharacterized protein MYCTH_2129150 [Thermothelomyces thermophilus ATCC 42464]AEO60057.1 hypothetical protein MYCTH_2129150 [Thermothelomyces thermophilus ATCC 42464]